MGGNGKGRASGNLCGNMVMDAFSMGWEGFHVFKDSNVRILRHGREIEKNGQDKGCWVYTSHDITPP
jgi:hypothetical protein